MTISRAIRIDAPTEDRNPRTADIDRLPTLDILTLINDEDSDVPAAVSRVLPQIAAAVDLAVTALQGGGRVHYFGAGTSGRIAVLDAAELVPTFALEPDTVVAHLAGGVAAFDQALEDVEDNQDEGETAASELGPRDVAVGLTASGRTPYVAGALSCARLAGASTVLISANPTAPLAALADVHIGVNTGPEVIAGSTRMKAGTAQKLVLNAFSTAVMIRIGRTYSNLMVHVVASNAKLRGRLVAMLGQATGASNEACEDALDAADGDAKIALLILLADVSPEQARGALAGSGGVVRRALQLLADVVAFADPLLDPPAPRKEQP
jgi:N-acetylmuramic acid 6-phosphate etherase